VWGLVSVRGGILAFTTRVYWLGILIVPSSKYKRRWKLTPGIEIQKRNAGWVKAVKYLCDFPVKKCSWQIKQVTEAFILYIYINYSLHEWLIAVAFKVWGLGMRG
jgi:hypothetical protein